MIKFKQVNTRQLSIVIIFLAIFLLSSCASVYISDNKMNDFKGADPVSGDANYNLYFSVDDLDQSGYKNFRPSIPEDFTRTEREAYERQQKSYHDWQISFSENIVNPVFIKNKLFLNETFSRKSSSYYLDIELRESNDDTLGVLWALAILLPIPLRIDRGCYLHIYVYDDKPDEFSKPLAKYKYNRTKSSWCFVFPAGLGGLFFTNDTSDLEYKSYKSAYTDMLLEFVKDVQNGKKGNVDD